MSLLKSAGMDIGRLKDQVFCKLYEALFFVLENILCFIADEIAGHFFIHDDSDESVVK